MFLKIKKVDCCSGDQSVYTNQLINLSTFFKVRMIGVEPTCLAALDPKSSASANFATSAFLLLFPAFCRYTSTNGTQK
jgi:hypothetical protein